MNAYQLGIFGHTTAGKTSLLLSLASSRNARLSETTAALVPLNESQINSAQASAFKEGQRWLTKARKELAQGGPVSGTQITTEHMLLQYDVARVGESPHRVHIFDYAGELVSADKQTDALAQKLVKTLSQLDGLIVMLPVCDPSDKVARSELDARLRDLAQTFTLIKQHGDKHGSQLSLPIALVLSKWDLLAQSSSYKHEQERALTRLESQGFEGFLDLYRVLKGVTLEGNFSFSVMSAFGSCELKSPPDQRPYYHPKKAEPLDAFGVVEPIVWLCERSQVQTFERLSGRTTQLETGGGLGRLHAPLRAWRLARDIKASVWRYRPGSEELNMLSKFRRSAVRQHWLSVLTVVATWGVISLTIEAVIDQQACRKALANIERADSPWEDVEESNLWLQSYIRSPSTRHILFKPFYSREDAQALSLKYGERFSRRFWEKINTEVDGTRKEAMVLSYVRDFPNSPYTSEAHALLKSLREARERSVWETPLNLAQSADDKVTVLEDYIAKGGAQASEVMPLLQSLKKARDDHAWGVATSAVDSEAQRAAITTYLGSFPDGLHTIEAHQLIAQLDANHKWEVFLSDYKQAMDRDPKEAYERLRIRGGDSERMRLLRAQFAQDAYNRITQDASRLAYELDYPGALSRVLAYLRFEDQYTTPELIKATQEKREELRRAYDQHLYTQILQAERTYPGGGNIACSEYMTAWSAREIPGVMASEIQTLLNSYDESKRGKFKLTVEQVKSDCSLIEEGTTFLLSGLMGKQQAHQIPDAVEFTSHTEQRFSIQLTAQRDSWGSDNPSFHHYEELAVGELLGHMRYMEWACDDDGETYQARVRLDKVSGGEVHRLPPWSAK